MPESDEQLIDRWRERGESSALAELAERYLSQFYGTARAMMLSDSQAEEVAQETMLKVVRWIDSFDTRATFRTWSYTILVNTIRSDLRRQKTRSKHFDAAADVTRVAATNQSHDIVLTQQETRNEIEHALAHLTDKQRTALVLMVIEGLSAADVAEIENCSVDAVYQRVSEARKSLRNIPALRQLWQEHR
ncbi:RNA polymerase sigma factor [Novipirellula caenicola]|uniref:ECF RNA polymerase sigma factor SigW n=1 Tax=Novipirellula caenicola TaxID=1536901 RepID=A0ABP9VR58_9BACT